MGAFGLWQWLVVLVIVALIFGTKKLRNLGGDLGGAMKGFKEAMNNGNEQTSGSYIENSSNDQTVENEVHQKQER